MAICAKIRGRRARFRSAAWNVACAALAQREPYQQDINTHQRQEAKQSKAVASANNHRVWWQNGENIISARQKERGIASTSIWQRAVARLKRRRRNVQVGKQRWASIAAAYSVGVRQCCWRTTAPSRRGDNERRIAVITSGGRQSAAAYGRDVAGIGRQTRGVDSRRS